MKVYVKILDKHNSNQIEKSLLSMEFSQEYMTKFLEDGSMSKEDLLRCYYGDDIKEKYKLIEKSIIEGF